jgi:hypothetical protein
MEAHSSALFVCLSAFDSIILVSNNVPHMSKIVSIMHQETLVIREDFSTLWRRISKLGA